MSQPTYTIFFISILTQLGCSRCKLEYDDTVFLCYNIIRGYEVGLAYVSASEITHVHIVKGDHATRSDCLIVIIWQSKIFFFFSFISMIWIYLEKCTSHTLFFNHQSASFFWLTEKACINSCRSTWTASYWRVFRVPSSGAWRQIRTPAHKAG